MIQTIKQWLYANKARRLKHEAQFDRLRQLITEQYDKLVEADSRLSRIVALETPRCAHVGRKMARIARGEG